MSIQPRANSSRPTRSAIAAAAALSLVWLTTTLLTSLPPLASSSAGVLLGVLAIARTRGSTRALWFNVTFTIAVAGAAAAWLAAGTERARRSQDFGDEAGLFQLDDTLGVRPAVDLVTSATLERDGELVYDVTYTIDADRLRVAWPGSNTRGEPCVLFFGGSFTFGEGVEDDETMPYLVGRDSGRRTRNFGYSGYGPQQMLAAIESGLVERSARCRPTHAVYQAVYHHVLRAAGRWGWDRHGPWYALTPDEGVVRRGNFDDPDRPLGGGPLGGLVPSGSLLARLLGSSPDELGVDVTTTADVALYHAIVARASRLLAERHPGLTLDVVYWDAGDSLGPYPLFAAGDVPKTVVVHPITTILPPSDDWQRDYKLPQDVHPTRETHARIAAYVAREIVGR